MNRFVYSLYQLPVTTDPLWLFEILTRFAPGADLLISIRGTEPAAVKRRIEVARKSNARSNNALSDIDSEVSFEEASRVLTDLSRGDERIVEVSLVVISRTQLDLDPDLFILEKDPILPLVAALGMRKRLHRSVYARLATTCDLIPNLHDPKEAGAAILKTRREMNLYFSPQDPRLEALHWLVVGASGSGKSFFTGLVLKRMLDQQIPMSVAFIDHNRSFRRFLLSSGSLYLEPQNQEDLLSTCKDGIASLNTPGTMLGIELSDLVGRDKKEGAHALLSYFEHFLRNRDSFHPVYLVLDECWNFLRDEPELIQRAFREFRKLNGAAVAITQSLSDFLTDASGQTICQNSPIRILLRQGEDLTQYQGILGLNSVEIQAAKSLKQVKGSFSECLIRTPYTSRIGRLYPNESEYALLRTDNIREEWTRELHHKRQTEVSRA